MPSNSDTLLASLKSFCERFASEKLDDYTKRLAAAPTVSTVPKEVNDPIWGTIKLQPIEVLILDSPILQRLRYVRQLGVVHWIYPGAVHSRFEHTLGVLHQAHALVLAINEAAPTGHSPPIHANYAGLVRLCAVLHDIGHGVFSHVSEHAIAKRPDVGPALQSFSEEHDLGKVQLSELIAYYVVGSPSFQNLLKTALDRLGNPISLTHGSEENARLISGLIQNSIVGKGISDSVPLLHELISGPFDADKLDYFIRDAKFAGVPTMLDMSRLVQKITVKALSAQELPEQIAGTVNQGEPVYYLFGLKWSGQAVLDELHLARVFLYAKIYRHQKVLAIEAMVQAFFDAIGSLEGMDTTKLVELSFQFSDDQLLWSEPEQLLKKVGIETEGEPQIAFASEILQCLRDRRVFVNALSLRPKYPGDPWESHKDQERGLRRLDEILKHPQKSLLFKADLVSEVRKLLAVLPEAAGSFDHALLDFSVVVSAKPPLSGGTEIDRAFIFQGAKTLQYRDITAINRSGWSDAYSLGSTSVYIFAPREISTLIYVAAESLIRKQHDVILPPAALELSKQSSVMVLALKKKLEEIGYYRGTPYDILPVPDRLNKADIPNIISAISSKLEAIDGPPQDEEARRPVVLSDRILLWLSQFRSDDNVSLAIEILRGIKILGREDTGRALTAFLQANPDFRGATIVILGGGKDSSAIQSYYSKDVPDAFGAVLTLEEAARRDLAAPVVFLDDFVGSGGQIKNILGNWFGDEDLKNDALDETRDLFNDKERTYLRGRKVGFVFVSGWLDGKKAVEEACTKVGLDATVHIEIQEKDIPFAFETVLAKQPKEKVAAFKAECERIGRSLLDGAGKSEEKVNSRMLGYGNRAMLMISRYNVPTHVLLCLWFEGQVDGVDWYPILKRRPKY